MMDVAGPDGHFKCLSDGNDSPAKHIGT